MTEPMAQRDPNGLPRRSSQGNRSYPGTASRMAAPLVGGSVPAVFLRPLSRSQLVSRANLEEPHHPISLNCPRPREERERNLYLGAPLGTHVGTKSRLEPTVTAAEQVRLKKTAPVVTHEPRKEESSPLAQSSIVCPYCRKCRCEACATPRSLPSRWICSKSIECGAEPALDYVTCLCCVKALFYHCGKNHEADGGVMFADKPCSCAPHRKFWRWGTMAAMSLILPCLCLYWPCKGCLSLAEKAYQSYHSNGCSCRSHPALGGNAPIQEEPLAPPKLLPPD